MNFNNLVICLFTLLLACKKDCETTDAILCPNDQIVECLIGSWLETYTSDGIDYPLVKVENPVILIFKDSINFSINSIQFPSECIGVYQLNPIEKSIIFESDCYNMEHTFDLNPSTLKLFKMGRHGLSTRQFTKI